MSKIAEHIFQPFGETLSLDDSTKRGGFSGYATLKGYLNNNYGAIFYGNDVFDVNRLLGAGFMPDSHGQAQGGAGAYTMEGSLGYYTLAREDSKGLFVNGKFHSKPKAQHIRSDIQERKADGISTGLSIGFYTLEYFTIAPKDYATQLSKYLAPEYLIQGMEDAKQWNQVKIVTKIEVFENSITPDPSVVPAQITQILSNRMGTLSKYMGKDVESRVNMGALCTLANALMYNDFHKAAFDKSLSSEESTSYLSNAIDEFKSHVLAIHAPIRALTDGITNDNDGDEIGSPNMLSKELRALFTDPEVFIPLAGLTNKQHGEAALGAVKGYLERQYSLAEANAKKKEILAGKVISKPNHKALKGVSEMMDNHISGMTDCKETLDEFLDMYDPSTNSNNTEAEMLQAEFLRMSFEPSLVN